MSRNTDFIDFLSENWVVPPALAPQKEAPAAAERPDSLTLSIRAAKGLGAPAAKAGDAGQDSGECRSRTDIQGNRASMSEYGKMLSGNDPARVAWETRLDRD